MVEKKVHVSVGVNVDEQGEVMPYVRSASVQSASEEKTFAEWGLGKAPLNSTPPEWPIPRRLAEIIADSAVREEKEVVQSYPWWVRPAVRWLRRATRD